MGWFGPTKEEVWRELCHETGAEFVEGGVWKGNKVRARFGVWTITLDTYTESSGENQSIFTRIRAPFVNPEAFRFKIYRKSVFSGLGKMLGMQDIEIGDPAFDEAFIIQGNDPFRVTQLFADPKLRQLIASQPSMRLEVKDSEGWFGPTFPDDVDELHLLANGVIKDKERLKEIFHLFSVALERLCQIGSAHKRDPEIAL